MVDLDLCKRFPLLESDFFRVVEVQNREKGQDHLRLFFPSVQFRERDHGPVGKQRRKFLVDFFDERVDIDLFLRDLGSAEREVPLEAEFPAGVNAECLL